MDVVQRLASVLAGRYEIESEIGRGGMALVFLARDLKHGRRVAVKVLRPDLAASIGIERFLREIQIGAGLQHPHIVPLHDSGEAGGLPFYVMAYVEGESLRDRLEREKQIPLDEAVRIARDVAEALGHAHSHGVVHRDVKPENILLAGDHAVVADFGIARALSAAAGDATGTGLAVGTPTYMSPEQAGGMDVDGRSDLYSLGCVLYEMLAGGPPFSGPTPGAVLARHMQETVPSVRIVRPTVPPGLEAVLLTLLAKTPADRYATASRFIEALDQPPAVPPAPARRRRRVLAGLAVLGLGVLVARWAFRDRTEVNPLGFVILPFSHRQGAEPSLLDGDQCQWRLSQALTAWDQVSVANDMVVQDAAQRQGDEVPGHDGWLRIARRLGYGVVVRGEVAEFGDTVFVVATAYRAGRGREVGQASGKFVSASEDVRRLFEDLAAQLLGLAVPGTPGPAGTRSLDAGRVFARGRQALAEGDLELAETRYLDAAQADPGFADAQFWLAQARAWRGLATQAWAPAAQRAADLRTDLSDPIARALVLALLDLARNRFPEACHRYAAALARDSTDFAAWFGLGECRFRDITVLPDSASPSGWSFRTSYHGAAVAYRRGLASAPFLSGAVSERLRRILRTEPGRFRSGRAPPPDTSRFWAYPALSGDTLAFVPYPAADVASGAAAEPPTLEAAFAHGRAVLSEIATSWAEAYPRSAAALAAVAGNLEDLARVGRGAVDVTAALTLARRARPLARTPLMRVTLAHLETRLLLKLERFEDARRLADSLVKAESAPDPRAAQPLAALAVLVGQPRRAARLLEAGVEYREQRPREAGLGDVPLPALAVRERLRAYAAVGAPADSVRHLTLLFDSVVGLVGGDPDGTLRRSLLEEPLAMAFPTVGPGPVHRLDAPNHLVRLQTRFAAGDRAGVRASLDTLAGLRRGFRPQDLAMHAFFQETWLRVRLGDTAAAVEALDRMLADFTRLSAQTLSDVVDAAALVRVLALRAEIGPAGSATARRWARAVATLWRDADPELLPLTRAMQRLAG